MNKLILTGLLAATAFSPSAHAAETAATSYMGVSAGSVDQKISVAGVGSGKESTTAYKVYGGFPFDNRFALELGYTDLGKVEESDGTSTVSAQPKALTAALVISQPLGDKFSVFGKLGLASTNPTLRANGIKVDHGSKSSLLAGIGATFNITSKLTVLIEYESYGTLIEHQNVKLKANMASAGIRYSF